MLSLEVVRTNLLEIFSINFTINILKGLDLLDVNSIVWNKNRISSLITIQPNHNVYLSPVFTCYFVLMNRQVVVYCLRLNRVISKYA